MLRWSQRDRLRDPLATGIEAPTLTTGGKLAAVGIAATALVLLASSAFDIQLGLPAFLAGVVTAVLVMAQSRSTPMAVLRGISWGVLPLVAGLFVLVEALQKTGVTDELAAQQPLAASTLGDVMGVPAWKQVPTWFVIAQNDEAIPPDAERQFAARMGATTVEIPSSHVAMVSHPAKVAELIEQAAQSVGATAAPGSTERS